MSNEIYTCDIIEEKQIFINWRNKWRYWYCVVLTSTMKTSDPEEKLFCSMEMKYYWREDDMK